MGRNRLGLGAGHVFVGLGSRGFVQSTRFLRQSSSARTGRRRAADRAARYVAMLSDYISPEERWVAHPNQDVVYGFGYAAVDDDPVERVDLAERLEHSHECRAVGL
jgi:hypothetical protein